MKDLKRYIPYAAAAVLFVLLGFFYCRPVLKGKALGSDDNAAAVSNVQEGLRYHQETGDYSWWTGALFSGMPAYQIGGGRYLADRLLSPFAGFLHRGPNHPAWIIIFYLICFFALLRSFGVEPWMSVVGAIAIALSSYFLVIIAAGHGGKTISIAYITLVVAGFCLTYRKRYWIGAAFVMFFTAMGFSAHIQMSYYLFMLTGLLFIAELWIHIKEKRLKDFALSTLVFVLALGTGLGTGSANIFANREYAEETMRGGHSDLTDDSPKGLAIDYATSWSYGIDETLSLLVPGAKGGASTARLSDRSAVYKAMLKRGSTPEIARQACDIAPLYWGEQPYTAGNVYVGAIVCFLFVLGCILVKGPYKWALVAATAFSICLSWGSNWMWLTRLFYDYFPLYSRFRAVSSILIVAEIAMPLLGFLAVKAITEGSLPPRKVRHAIFISAGITGGVCLVLALFGRSMFDFTCTGDSEIVGELPKEIYAALLSDRASLLIRDSWRSLAFIAFAAALLFFSNEGKLPYRLLVPALGVLVIADLWPVDRRYFNDSNFHDPVDSRKTFQMQVWEKRLRLDKDPHFRVMNIAEDTFNDARTSFYFKSIGGYHAAKLRRYQDLIDTYLDKHFPPVVNMLNAKYIIYFDEDKGMVRTRENPDAMGNAWFVEKLVAADTPREEMDALETIDLHTTAVFDRSFAPMVRDTLPGIADDASIKLTAYTPKRLDYEYISSKPGTVVFSEIYYPHGWKASIDGADAGHYRVNYTLRAMDVPAGSHHITFVFEPDSVRRGDAVATVCVVLMYLFLAAAIVIPLTRRKNRQLI